MRRFAAFASHVVREREAEDVAAPAGLRLADAATDSQEIDRAVALRCWLRESWPHPDAMVRDVVRLGPNALLESLAALGQARLDEEGRFLM